MQYRWYVVFAIEGITFIDLFTTAATDDRERVRRLLAHSSLSRGDTTHRAFIHSFMPSFAFNLSIDEEHFPGDFIYESTVQYYYYRGYYSTTRTRERPGGAVYLHRFFNTSLWCC